MKDAVSPDSRIMELPVERRSRKRQRKVENEGGSGSDASSSDSDVFEPVKEGSVTIMTAGSFSIPILHRSDIEKYYPATETSGRKDDESSSSMRPTANVGDVITKTFEKYQAVYLPRFFTYPGDPKEKGNINIDTANILHWRDLSNIYENLSESDKESFCIENEGAAKSIENNGENQNNNENTVNSSCFLKELPINTNTRDDRAGYCSFMIQNDKRALSDLLHKLPVQDPVTDAFGAADKTDGDANGVGKTLGWEYEPCLWIFFGRNNSFGDGELEGRPEHTDQISNDGTWHYQLSGTKRWLLRPTPLLLRSWKHDSDTRTESDGGENKTDPGDGEGKQETKEEIEIEIEPKQTRIDCRSGDVLIVNTRLWRHQTVLPPQTEPSVSYARDFWIHKDGAKNEGDAVHATTNTGAMTNVDGLYAMDDIVENTIIFREDDMPDCELHRTSEAGKANCKVVELEDGMQAVVSSKLIKAGEFFCIPDSSDEEGSDEDDDEGDGWFEDGEEDD